MQEGNNDRARGPVWPAVGSRVRWELGVRLRVRVGERHRGNHASHTLHQGLSS